MRNGFKQSKGPTTKERIKALEVDIKNAQMALNINQMMVKQLMQLSEVSRQDVTNLLNLANDLQYRTAAMINLLGVDIPALDAEADKLKLKDYNDASDKEDKEKGFTIGDIVKEESIIVITSTTESEEDAGLFRSKIPVSDIPYEQMKKDVIGKVVGDKFDADFNGVIHNVEILGIRELPVKLEVVMDEDESKCQNDCSNCGCGCSQG